MCIHVYTQLFTLVTVTKKTHIKLLMAVMPILKHTSIIIIILTNPVH